MLNRTFKRNVMTALLGFVGAGLMATSAAVYSQAAADSAKDTVKSIDKGNQNGAPSAGASVTSGSKGADGTTPPTSATGSKDALTAGTAAADKPAAGSGKLAAGDRNLIREMAQTNLAEIETGKLAQSKSKSDEVKSFAQKMIDDHTAALNELQQLAQSKGLSLPAAPDAKHQAALKKLDALSGAQFDRKYMAQAGVKDHHQAQRLMQRAAGKAKDADLKAYAAKSLAVVDAHLKTAQQMKGGTAGTSMGSSSAKGANAGAGDSGGK